jgi:hypothetical protein
MTDMTCGKPHGGKKKGKKGGKKGGGKRRLIVLLLCAGLLLTIVGCGGGGFWQRTVLPGPDMEYGTADDIVLDSEFEDIAAAAKTVSEMFGYGWVGLILQGVAMAVAMFSARRGINTEKD